MLGMVGLLVISIASVVILEKTVGRRRDEYFRERMRRLNSDSDPANMMIRDLKRRLRK